MTVRTDSLKLIVEERNDDNNINLLEGSNACDLVSWMNNSWGSSLRPHQHNVDQLRCRRNWAHRLEIVNGHGYYLSFEEE